MITLSSLYKSLVNVQDARVGRYLSRDREIDSTSHSGSAYDKKYCRSDSFRKWRKILTCPRIQANPNGPRMTMYKTVGKPWPLTASVRPSVVFQEDHKIGQLGDRVDAALLSDPYLCPTLSHQSMASDAIILKRWKEVIASSPRKW